MFFFPFLTTLSLPFRRHRPPLLDHALLFSHAFHLGVTLGARDFWSAVSGFCQVSAFGQHRKFPPHARKTSGIQGTWVSSLLSESLEQTNQSVTQADRKKKNQATWVTHWTNLSKIYRSFVLFAHLRTVPPWLLQCCYVEDAGLEQ